MPDAFKRVHALFACARLAKPPACSRVIRPDGTRTFCAPDNALVPESLFHIRSALERTPNAPSWTFHGPPVAARLEAADAATAGFRAAGRVPAGVLIVVVGAVITAGAGSGIEATTTGAAGAGLEAATGTDGSACATRAPEGTELLVGPDPSATEASCEARRASVSCLIC